MLDTCSEGAVSGDVTFDVFDWSCGVLLTVVLERDWSGEFGGVFVGGADASVSLTASVPSSSAFELPPPSATKETVRNENPVFFNLLN